MRCFNEAEAIKPRNPSRHPAAPAALPGFNEAEAIKPRNLKSDETATGKGWGLQ